MKAPKKITLAIAALLLAVPVQAETLTASVTKTVTVDEARAGAFDNLPRKISMAGYAQMDPDRVANLVAIASKQTCLSDRFITDLGPNGYAVHYYGETTAVYYDRTGKLKWVGIDSKPLPQDIEDPIRFPLRGAVYRKGRLYWITYTPRFAEDYIFTPGGRLKSIWKGNFGYTPSGVLIGARGPYRPCNPQAASK